MDQSARAGRSFLPALQSLRGLAALWVVLYHLDVALRGAGLAMLGISGIRAGWLGVDLFFVLSAYLLGPPFLEGRAPRYRRFLADRFLRIAPAYYAAAAVSAAVLLVFFRDRWDPLAASFSLVFLNNSTGKLLLALNPVFWTLAVEMQFYLLLPLLARLFTGRRWPWGLALCLAASYLFRGLTYQMGGEWIVASTFWFPAFLGHFALGLAAARIRTVPWPALAGLLGCLLVGVPVALWITPGDIAYGYDSLPGQIIVRTVAACGFALILLAAATPGRIQRALEVRPLQALGNMSYSLYLAHLPAQVVVQWAVGLTPEHRTQYILVAAAASLVYGAMLYGLVERPAELLRRRLKARAAQA
ncbi:MAG: acyltransferase [Halobacteriales archaeon]|nr:acyltransferase [Halobacteriales archaeon]